MSGSRHFVARARRRSGQLAWRLALGPVSGATPTRYITSIVEQAWRPEVAKHLVDARVLAEAHVEHYPLDGSLPTQFRRSRAFDTRHLYRLRDVCVSPRTGLAWLPGGPILGESFGSLERLLGWDNGVLHEPLLRPSTTIEGPVVVLRTAAYFHWLLESLPSALHALAVEPDSTLVVSPGLPRFAREAIELLGIRKLCFTDEPIVAERLVFAAHGPSGFVPHEDVEAVRAAVLPLLAPASRGSDGLYVSRRLATRSPTNEPELEEVARRLGLKVVRPETLPFDQQVGLFAGATRLAGTHGAGLANLVFAAHLAELVEIFPIGKFNDCYARLAAGRGAAYEPFYCTGESPGASVAPLAAIESALGSSADGPA